MVGIVPLFISQLGSLTEKRRHFQKGYIGRECSYEGNNACVNGAALAGFIPEAGADADRLCSTACIQGLPDRFYEYVLRQRLFDKNHSPFKYTVRGNDVISVS